MKTAQEHIAEPVPDTAAVVSAPAHVPESDSWRWELPVAGYSDVFGADTVHLRAQPVVGTAAEVFGGRSRLETVEIQPPLDSFPQKPDRPTVNLLLLDGLTVFLLLVYLAHLYRFHNSIVLLFRSFFIPGQFDALIEEQSVTFRTFVRFSCLIGGLSLLAIGLKWAILWSGLPAADAFPDYLIPFLAPILVGVLVVVWLYKRIVMGIIAGLTGNSALIEKIDIFNRLCFTTSSLFLAPTAVLTGLADPWQEPWLILVQFILLILLVLFYTIKSFSFFLSRKISILQWILYLCAVEIFPVSFFVLFAMRGFEW